MPGPIHQGLRYLLQRSPDLVFELARAFDEAIEHDYNKFEHASNELPDPGREDNVLHADVVVAAVFDPAPTEVAAGAQWRRCAGLAVEIQTSDDQIKYYSWLSHAAGVRRVFECRGWTMVFAPDPDVRRRAQKMFVNEPRASPWFVVPEMLPPITDIEHAKADVKRAVLTTVFHARSDQGVACARATLEALAVVPLAREDQRIYHDLVTASLQPKQLEQLPARLLDIDDNAPLGPMELTGAYYVRGHRDGREEGLEEGREEGREEDRKRARRILHSILACRDLAPTEAQRARIDHCEDPAVLERWIDAALTARSCAEVFEPSA